METFNIYQNRVVRQSLPLEELQTAAGQAEKDHNWGPNLEPGLEGGSAEKHLRSRGAEN